MNHTESLILWYLRFNGYFTTPSLTTHPDFKKEAGSSDADVLAVRFQYSEERQRGFIFERDPRLIQEVPIDVVLVEVKSSACALNENWTNETHGNVEYALRWVGRWIDQAVNKIAKDVYKCGEWRDAGSGELVRFVCFGRAPSTTLKANYPMVSQLLFRDVIRYMRDRMNKNCYQVHRERWEPFIRCLGERFEAGRSDEEILEWIVGGVE